MKPIVLEGNLGERHRSLNSAIHEAFHNTVPFSQIKDQKEVSDVDRLFKIDFANKCKDLNYILQTLKSEDTLYATRALKCTWLFSDDQYEHIVNPKYLYDTLFPDMMTLVVRKFIAKILKHTRDYVRCEQFYKHYKGIKSDRADKFLPLCSPQFIHNEIGNPDCIVSAQVLQYFCKKSPEAIQAYFTRFTNKMYTWNHIYSVRMLYFSNGELFLNLLEKYINETRYCQPKLGYRISKDILKNHKKRILNNFKIYKRILNGSVLYKSLTEDEVKHIISIITPDDLTDFWHASTELKTYIEILKPNDRLSTFICLFQRKFPTAELEMSSKFYTDEWYKYMTQDQQQVWALTHVELNSEFCGLKVYSWYKFCKFDVALTELKKTIKTEKTPEERINMLNTLVDTLGNSTEHAHTLLSYFKERHMNEMPHMKERFLRRLLKWDHIYKIEEKTWLLLNEIFISLGLSEDMPTTRSGLLDDAIHFTFAYSIINDKPLTDKLKSQFIENFSYLRGVRKLVNTDCEDKLFEALYQLLKEKKKNILTLNNNWVEMKNTIDQFITLFHVWKKSTTDNPHIVQHIRNFSLVWERNDYVSEFKDFFTTEELLSLELSEKAFLKCLKTDVDILRRFMPKINKCLNSDRFHHKTLLRKLRIYFHSDLAKDWSFFIINKLLNSTSRDEQIGLANTITSFCLLLPAQQFQETIEKYIPKETKVDMLNADMHLFSLQKIFAKRLYLTRPLFPDIVLLFAKGDFLQYASNTLVSISVQMSLSKFTTFVESLLNNPVSIQKHAIRLAFKRLPISHLRTLMENLWVNTKNISIKEVVFDCCFQIMCQQSTPEDIHNWWHLVRKFIQEMEGDDYRSLYPFINQIRQTPEAIQPELCFESWYCMKRVPVNKSILNLKNTILNVIKHIFKDIKEDFIYDVITELIEDAFPNNFSTSKRLFDDDIWMIVVSKYLIYCEDSLKQNERIGKVLNTILNRTKNMWSETKDDMYIVRHMFNSFIYSILNTAIEEIYQRDNKYISCIALLEVIQRNMTEKLTIQSSIHYVIKFVIIYLNCVKNVTEDISSIELYRQLELDSVYKQALHVKTSQPFGVELAAMQNSLIRQHSAFIQVFFTKFLRDFLNNCMSKYNNKDFKISLIEGLILDPSQIHNVLTAIELLPASDSVVEYKYIIEKIKSLNHIEVEFLLNMKYGENKRHKFS